TSVRLLRGPPVQMNINEMMQHEPQPAGGPQIAVTTSLVGILEDHTPDQQLALVGGTKLHSLLQRDDRRQLLMRGDRRNLLLRQAAQREAILIGYHRSLCGDTASGRLYAPAMIQGNKLRTAYCRQGH